MYLLPYLCGLEKTQGQPVELVIEFRLACSGEFYNRRGMPGSWRSFEMARLLLLRPFELYVVSRPFNSFPQELCLRFGVNYEWNHQSGGGSIGTTPPYGDLVEDVCAVLTLLSRRLVVPVLEVRVTSARRDEYSMRTDSFNDDHPSPIVGLGHPRGRTLRTSRFVTTGDEADFEEHTPPPLGSIERRSRTRSFRYHNRNTRVRFLMLPCVLVGPSASAEPTGTCLPTADLLS